MAKLGLLFVFVNRDGLGAQNEIDGLPVLNSDVSSLPQEDIVGMPWLRENGC